MSQTASGTLEKRGHSVVRFDVDVKNLYVKRVSLGSDESLSMAVLGVHPAKSNGDAIRFEQVWDIVKKGQRVTITARPSEGDPVVVLHGWIQGAQIGYGGRSEDLEYMALGLDWSLKTEKVFGSWCRKGDSKTECEWFRGIPPVFNKDGLYNKSTKDYKDSDGNDRVIFELDDALDNPDNAWWNAAQMARYLVSCERKSDLSDKDGNIFKKDYQPGGEIADFRPFDVNVDDEDIWSALVKVAHRCSHGVRIRYQKDRSKTELAFFSRKIDDATGTKQIEVPEANLDTVHLDDPMKTAAVLDVQYDLSGVVRRVDVISPPKLYDSTFTLLEGWKLEDEEAAFGGGAAGTAIANFLKETDPQTSSDWERFKWVGRRWILNETGRDDCTTPVGPYDFAPHFGQDAWTVHRRPFRHSRIKKDTDEDGAPLPILVHVKFGGTMPQDIQLGVNVKLLPDRAGIYFAGAPMVSIKRGLESGGATDILPSEVTIDAVVEGDQDAPSDVNEEGGEDDQPVPTFGIVRLDEGYRQNNIDEDSSDAEDAAHELAKSAVDEMKHARLVGTAVIPWISFAFEVGDVIDKINGRNLKVKAIVAKVSHDVEQQATELALEYPAIDTATHSRQQRNTASVGAHDGRAAQGLAYVADLLALQAMGHPVDEALRAAVGGASRSEVERLLRDVLPGRTRWDDPQE